MNNEGHWLWVIGFSTLAWTYTFLSEDKSREFRNSRENPEKWVLGKIHLAHVVGALSNVTVVEGEFC